MDAVSQPTDHKRAVNAALATVGAGSLAILLLPGVQRGMFSSQFLPRMFTAICTTRT